MAPVSLIGVGMVGIPKIVDGSGNLEAKIFALFQNWGSHWLNKENLNVGMNLLT